MIVTSYFRNLKKLKEFETVSVAARTPKWFEGEREYDFAPSMELLYDYKKGRITQEQYRRLYIEELNNLDKFLIAHKLENYNSAKTAFLCYEKPEEFCHRHVLAEWINNTFYIEVKELQ